jgi:signal transduction histidine kinase
LTSSSPKPAAPSPLNRQQPGERVAPEIACLERLFAAARWPWRRAAGPARERARTVLRASRQHEDGAHAALLAYAVEMFCGLAVELAARPAEAGELILELERSVGLSPLALGRGILRSPELVRLPPAVAAEVQLGLLTVFAPLREVSLWTRDEAGRVSCVRRVGSEVHAPGARAFAERLLSGRNDPPGRRRAFIGLPVTRWQQPIGALVGQSEPGGRERCQAFMADAVPILTVVLERDDLLTRSAAAERALLAPTERRLSRLGLDLHDGPLQDLGVLGGDLRLLRDDLGSMLASPDGPRLVRGRLDDIEAHLVALDADLRRVCSSLQSPFLLRQTLATAVRDITDSFAARAGIVPRVRLQGGLTELGDPVALALLAVIREALNNARKHSDATEVAVTVAGHRDRVEAEVRDNGRGFEVERTLVRAARDGHLGLAGLHERVRILGGQAHVESAPGGPTVISVVLPRIEPTSPSSRSG